MPEQPDPVTQHLVCSGLFAHVSSLGIPHRGRGLLCKLKISPNAQNSTCMVKLQHLPC